MRRARGLDDADHESTIGAPAKSPRAKGGDDKGGSSRRHTIIACVVGLTLMLLLMAYGMHADEPAAAALRDAGDAKAKSTQEVAHVTGKAHKKDAAVREGLAAGMSNSPPEVAPKPRIDPQVAELARLRQVMQENVEIVKALKAAGKSIELAPEAQAPVREIQAAARKICVAEFGPEPYTLDMYLRFPETMPDFAVNGADGVVRMEMAPLSLQPYAVYHFMKMALRGPWRGGHFHRNAGHVKQANVEKQRLVEGLPMPFQEYSAEFPHTKYTMGYAGRPGGPAFYISIIDNTRNHGPGTQAKDTTEADTNFATVIDGFDVVKRMNDQPGGPGFIKGRQNYILILNYTMVPQEELLKNDLV